MTTTLEVSEELATHIKAHGHWLPAIIELSAMEFRTPVAASATEFVRFLLRNPTPHEILGFYVSDEAQDRLCDLLCLNSAGPLSSAEKRELDEIDRLGDFITNLKMSVLKQLHNLS